MNLPVGPHQGATAADQTPGQSEEFARTNSRLTVRRYEAHYAENPHLAPSAEEVPRAVLEQQHRLPAELDELRAERDQAREVARWLYQHGGQQLLDAGGGGDTSEWPWLTAPASTTSSQEVEPDV